MIEKKLYRKYRKIPVIPAHNDGAREAGDMREAELDYLMNTTTSETEAKRPFWEDLALGNLTTEQCNCYECRKGLKK